MKKKSYFISIKIFSNNIAEHVYMSQHINMITVCIPVYNFDVNPLILKLSGQAKTLSVPVEIILIDDCSSELFKRINRDVWLRERYIELDKNIGRSKIRNLFLAYATFDYLLFLDCDSTIISDDFLLNYANMIIDAKPGVVCGGRIYDNTNPGRKKLLNWKYGIKKESRSVDVRCIFPNRSFMSNNFLISKKIFEKINFDERIIEYGHEDTLFGYQLNKNKITVTHIDNPVLTRNYEDNDVYLSKTEKGISNLSDIVRYVNFDRDFTENNSLLRFHDKIIRSGTENLIYFLFILSKPMLRSALRSGYFRFWMFDFYKLGIFIQKRKHRKTTA